MPMLGTLRNADGNVIALAPCSRRNVALLLSPALKADFDAQLLNQRVLRNVA